MTPDWMALIGCSSRRELVEGTVAGICAAIAVGTMEWCSVAAGYPLAVIPFATSIVLVMGSPEAAPAQPRALIGGHLVSALAGFAVLRLTGPHAWAAAAAVGVAILAMVLTDTFHPPAGISPLLIVSGNLPWSFLLAPVLAGVLLLAAFAYGWHRWVSRRPWPRPTL
ncbi:HPP family protein [Bradyrhizobium uaiense]|uniref:HPP family protein n=1 Tax=Bradyrhizobium uaiense TaxID=2594946 RepID=A0A6P1BH73_9BRAD|nr:HPP family protein [Bradyrhizobium uaiense]NEU97603.1 HPP family protein [Bradyrhizobium uaiense]